ncbi:glyoxalase/bleomycin resistance/extradiol dioxygenase family protein [Arthrobacter sp.]|uniref:VOC family protein n=1 Tax=Arthrobacter sp. TaxID=1667 RepID=UPI0026DF877B|nr:VOC family protein [Arthrobacter sp.]MDO5753389.1 VOC family protein [Arthrobacter sp.]
MPTTPNITPILVYADIEAALSFLVEAFGFEPGPLHRSDDGQVVHGEVYANGGPIWLHRETPEHDLSSPRSHQLAFGGLAILVEDVDTHYERARAAGAMIEQMPQDQPYGRREYGVRDREGHRWWFGTEVE